MTDAFDFSTLGWRTAGVSQAWMNALTS